MLRTLLAVLALFAAFPAPQASAQIAGTAAPAGSYRQTCQNISFNGTMLRASCLFGSELKWYQSLVGAESSSFDAALDVTYCRSGSDIWNGHADLYCRGKVGHYSGNAVPTGSYVDSCAALKVVAGTLQAYCVTGNGDEQLSILPLALCDTERSIDNIRGQLVCIPAAGASAPKVVAEVDPRIEAKYNTSLTAQAGIAWQKLMIGVWGRQCKDILCLADVHVLAGKMRAEAVALQASQADESSLHVQGQVNSKYGKLFETAASNSRVRANPNATPDALLHAFGCGNFLGRAGQYLCTAKYAYALCAERFAKGSVQACYGPGQVALKPKAV